jgi:ACS family hexuronate transporter-like MFS transporter
MKTRRATRWVPTAAMMLLSLLSYVDRNILALLSPTILRETRLSAEDYGWIISAFSVAYLIGNPVWGRVLDRFGVRLGVGVAAALWTCASALHARATGMASFVMARAVLGFGEGATFPGGLRTATSTLDEESRARGVALAYSGGSLGAILTPLLVTPIAARWGWRGAFGCTGVLGAAWLAIWAIVSRRPELRAPKVERSTRPPTFRDPSLWGFAAAYAFGGVPIGFVLYGAPIHLARGLGCDQVTIGHVLWIPPLGWEVGYFFWGWLLDRGAHDGAAAGPNAVASLAPAPSRYEGFFATLAVLAIPFAAAPWVRSLPLVLALLFFAMFVSAGYVIVSLSEVTQRYSTQHAAYLAGVGAGSWSGLIALVMPIFGRLFDRGAYGAAYAIATGAPLVGWALWRFLARGRGRVDLQPPVASRAKQD